MKIPRFKKSYFRRSLQAWTLQDRKVLKSLLSRNNRIISAVNQRIQFTLEFEISSVNREDYFAC